MSFDKNNKTHITAAIAITSLTTIISSAMVKKAIKRKKEKEAFIKSREEFEELIDILSELSCQIIKLAEENEELKSQCVPNNCTILRHPTNYRN